MSVFWQVFLAVIAAWLVTRTIGAWLVNHVLNTAEKTRRLQVAGREHFARAVVDELERRDMVVIRRRSVA